jgi:hypothetical protein
MTQQKGSRYFRSYKITATDQQARQRNPTLMRRDKRQQVQERKMSSGLDDRSGRMPVQGPSTAKPVEEH